MRYFRYVNEIKSRAICIIVSCCISSYMTYTYKAVLLYILIKPSQNILSKQGLYFIYTNLSELFYTYIDLVITVTAHSSGIFILFQIISFLKPGLYYSEKKLINKYFIILIITWFITIFATYKYIIPFSWTFFINIQDSIGDNKMDFFFEAKLNEYLSFVTSLFNILLLNLLLINILLTYVYEKKETIYYIKLFRKKIYFALFFIASIITPPDIISQLTVGFMSIFLLELYIYVLIIDKNLMEAN